MDPKNFYNRTAEHYDLRHSSQTTMAIRRREGRMLARFCRGRIIDIGCGTGYHLDKYDDITGIDISEEMVKRAKGKGNAMLADASALPFRDSSFDTAISMFNVMDRPDFENMVKEASRVVRPGGHFLLSIGSVYDNDYSWHEKRKMKLNTKYPTRKKFHVRGVVVYLDMYTREEIGGVFRKHHFEPIYFDSAFILQKPRWGDLRPFSYTERARLAAERLLPKEYGCMYFMGFRKVFQKQRQ